MNEDFRAFFRQLTGVIGICGIYRLKRCQTFKIGHVHEQKGKRYEDVWFGKKI